VGIAINTKVCTRCHGSGSHSFNLKDGTVCYGCGGSEKVVTTPKGQKKVRPTCNSIHNAAAGDILEMSCVLYKVEEIRWVPYTVKPSLPSEPSRHWNQQLKVTRMLDDKTYYFKRVVCSDEGIAINTPEEWVGEIVVGKGIVT